MPAPGWPSGRAPSPSGSHDRIAHVVGERHLGAGPGARRAPGTPRSSRSAGDPAGRSASRPRTAAPTRARAGAARWSRVGRRPRRGRRRPPRLRRGARAPSRASRPRRAARRARVSPRVASGAGPGHAGRGERDVPRRRSGKCAPRRAILGAVERRLISGHSPYEPVVGFSRAVVAGGRVHVSGTAPIPPDGSPPPEGAYDQAAPLPRDHRRGADAGRARRSSDVVRTASTSPTRTTARDRACARRGVRRDAARRDGGRRRSCSTRPGRSRSRPRRCCA